MKREVIVTLADGTELRVTTATPFAALALWTAVGNIVTGYTKTTSPPVSVRLAE
jgi:hypothetical protein